MKSYRLFITAFFLMIVIKVSAQDFGAVGTTWYFTLPSFSDPSIDYVQVKSIDDTIINGQACHHLQVLHGYDCSTIDSNAFVYEQNGIVYYFVSQMNKFSELYNFNVTPGNAYTVYVNGIFGQPDSIVLRITGVFNDTVNGNILKKRTTLKLTGAYSFSTTIQDTFSERIGASYLFPQYSLCEAAPNQLRCFQDSLLGFYTTNAAPSCDFISTGINDSYPNVGFELYPNPANDFAELNLAHITIKNFSLKIFDVLGDEMKVPMQTSQQTFRLDLSSLSQGIYFLQVSSDNKFSTQKLLKQ
jgi:hypothetical protein